MTQSATEYQPKNERHRRNRQRLSESQISIERHAIRLRSELRVSDFCALPHDAALARIPNCEVWALKNLPGVKFETVNHFRTDGFHIGAFAIRDEAGVVIVFNDAHPPNAVRVNLMEEFFHIWLGHRPDVLSVYGEHGSLRTHDAAKEHEAYGCAIAALLPYAGLEALLARGSHVDLIAERFAVPTLVVEQRIAATKLGDLANSTNPQLALTPIAEDAY
jgi:Zn-dependent peptidase ImmA (M78 family)